MSDCNVCLYIGDYEHPSFFHKKLVKARKSHECFECREQIRLGQNYWKIIGKWDGKFDQFRICTLCEEIAIELACNGGRMYGCLWEDLQEQVFPEMTFSCIQKLKTTETKVFLQKHWNKWKNK